MNKVCESLTFKCKTRWAWWYTPVTLATRRLRQEADHEFEASPDYIAKSYLKKYRQLGMYLSGREPMDVISVIVCIKHTHTCTYTHNIDDNNK